MIRSVLRVIFITLSFTLCVLAITMTACEHVAKTAALPVPRDFTPVLDHPVLHFNYWPKQLLVKGRISLRAWVEGPMNWCPGAITWVYVSASSHASEESDSMMLHDCDRGPWSAFKEYGEGEYDLGIRLYEKDFNDAPIGEKIVHVKVGN